MIAVSAFGGIAGEGVSLNTHLNTGDYYVRVRGQSGAFDADSPFNLGIALLTGVCKDVAPIARAFLHGSGRRRLPNDRPHGFRAARRQRR